MLRSGLLAYKAGDFETAISQLSECLQLSPGNKFALQYLDLAKKALWAKREEEIDIKSPFYNMINNMIIRGEQLFQQKEYEKSIDIWKSILFIFPLNKTARDYIVECSKFINPQLFAYFIQEHLDYGKKYMEQGLKNYALKEFELIKKVNPAYQGIDELIKSVKPAEIKRPLPDPKLIALHYNQGLAFYEKQQFEEAIKSWEKVLELEPDNEKAILNINKVNQILNYDKIKVERVNNVAKNKEIENYYLTGLKYYNNGDLVNAITMWEQVLRIDPDNIKAKNNIRTCKIILKKY